MGHNHDHAHGGHLRLGLVLNTAYTCIEFAFGILTGSVALLADAAHNLTDTLTLFVSFVAQKISGRAPTDKKSFGYGRATILAALFNATLMIGISGVIAFESFQRLTHPHPVAGGVVALVALGGIAVNGFIAYLLSKQRHDLNIKSAYIDMLFDTLSSVGAVLAGVIMYFAHVYWIDGAIGIVISIFLGWNAIKILLEAVHILYDGTPHEVDVIKVTNAIKSIEGVHDVDDMHIWAIRSHQNALSCHITVGVEDFGLVSRAIVESIKRMLDETFHIHHATIEVETSPCNPIH